VTPAAVVLAFSVYAAFYAASIPLMSKLADVRGYKPVYGVSMAVFAAGSALAALAPSLPVLVGARLLQGIGGGGLFPVAQALVGAALSEKEQGKALGILMGVFAVGGVLGPNLGGFLVQHLSWHWIFWINVPLGVLGVLLLLRTDIPETRRDGAIDWVGAALVAILFGSLVLSIEGLRDLQEEGFFSLRVGGVMGLVALSLALLIPRERRQEEPIVDFRLVASSRIAPLLGVSALVGYALLGGVVFAPLYVQLMFGASALGSGAVLNAVAGGLGLSSWIAGTYTSRLGGRPLVIAGMALTAGGIGLMIVLQMHLWGMLFGLALLGAGLGLSQGPISYLGLTLAPEEDRGQVAGLISITRSMGGAMGITLAGVLLSQASERLAGRLNIDPERLANQVWGTNNGLQVLGGTSGAEQETVRQALGSGLVEGWYLALGAALLGLVLSLAVKSKKPEAEPSAA
ncbi:MAG: MFS transporter, partial [Rhodothermales bacterium]